MGWDRQKAYVIEPPVPFALGRWLLAVVLMIIAGVLLFILQASGVVKALSTINIWLLALAPVGLWLLIFCLYGYFYSRKLDQFHFLQHEAEYAQQQWSIWAERYLPVLSSAVLLPDGISAQQLSSPSAALPQQYGLVRRIHLFPQKELTINVALKCLLDSVQAGIRLLPAELSLRVTWLTDEPGTDLDDYRAVFNQCWQMILPDRQQPLSLNVTDHLSLLVLDERLKHADTTVELILVTQIHGGEHYSDGLAVLLLTSDDVAQKYHLLHMSRVLRPMLLEMRCFEEDMTLFLTTQTAASRTSDVLGDAKTWTDKSAELITLGNAHNAGWRAENIQILEKTCGVPGPLSPWLVTALGADLVSVQKSSWIVLSTTGAESFVNTIIPGSEDERTE